VLDHLARLGYATKGALYLVIGGLAVLYAIGEGGALMGNREAMRTVARQSFGDVLIWATGVGLAAFAAWRVLQALLDPGSERRDLVQAGKRVGWFASGVAHGGLAIAAFQLAMGQGSSSERTFLAKLFALPYGHKIAMIAGLVVLGVALHQLWMAGSARFMRELSTGAMTARQETWARRAGRFGLAAHGSVLAVVGYFLLRAASNGRSSEAKTTSGAMYEIATSPSGSLLFSLVAVGLVGYALHMFFTARYRRVDVPA
jgi:hypothetical protein